MVWTMLMGMFVAGPTTAMAAPGRVALVIGNNTYRYAPNLEQARADARKVAGKLEDLDFRVLRHVDLDRAGMVRAMADFEKALGPADVGFFYYAGHAVQVDGLNYLVPVDGRLADPAYIAADAFDVTQALQAMHLSDNKLNVLVLDACRNNPWASQWTGTNRSFGSRGLDPVTAPAGSFLVAFATAPDDVASDSGVYADSLVRWLGRPCTNVMEIFANLSDEVANATKLDQRPWMNITGNAALKVYPAGCEPKADPVVVAPAPKPKTESQPPKKTNVLPAGTRIRVVAFDEADAFYGDRASLVDKVGSVAEEFTRTDGDWWGGPVNLDGEGRLYFYKIKIALLE